MIAMSTFSLSKLATRALLFFSLIFFSKSSFALQPTDTTYYYFQDGTLSMVESPWTGGYKTYQIFGKANKPVYEIVDARHSFSTSTTFTFYENGAVKSAQIHTNPGASLYFYETEIRFDRTNVPMSKKTRRSPAQSIEDSMGETFLWKADPGIWIKQEIMECYAVPEQ
jgi:hypothetical protein